MLRVSLYVSVSSPEKWEHLNTWYLYLLCLARIAFKHDCITTLLPPAPITRLWKQFTELYLQNWFWKIFNIRITHSPYAFAFYKQKTTNYVTFTVRKTVKICWMNEVWKSLKYHTVIKKYQFLLIYNGLWPNATTWEKSLQLDRTRNTRTRL